jgi:hypothetical protein
MWLVGEMTVKRIAQGLVDALKAADGFIAWITLRRQTSGCRWWRNCVAQTEKEEASHQ